MPDLELTELQLAVMRVLWDRTEAPVADVHAALAPDRGLALTTVATILSRLEKAGLVGRRPEGRHFVYRALVSEEDVRRSMVSGLADRLFQGDVTALVSHLLSEAEIADGDLERVRQLILARQRKEP
jgi:BlaI family transcriptional regulator, penicillinase repressor